MCLDLPSTSAEITLPNADKDRLIFVASFKRSPVEPVKANKLGIINHSSKFMGKSNRNIISNLGFQPPRYGVLECASQVESNTLMEPNPYTHWWSEAKRVVCITQGQTTRQ
jgi:hypothetical protein